MCADPEAFALAVKVFADRYRCALIPHFLALRFHQRRRNRVVHALLISSNADVDERFLEVTVPNGI